MAAPVSRARRIGLPGVCLEGGYNSPAWFAAQLGPDAYRGALAAGRGSYRPDCR